MHKSAAPHSSPIIALEDVSFSYVESAKRLFEHLCLKIDRDSHVVVAGPDGAGKTTLAKIIKGLLLPQQGRVIYGCDKIKAIGYIGGDPYDILVGISIQEDVAFGLEGLLLQPCEMEVRLSDALRETGLTGMEERLTHTLSGGEQQKTALAGVLAMGPRVLILDDAFTMLDRKTKKSIRGLIESLSHIEGMTVIECTNDMEAICTAGRVIFLTQNGISFDGSAEGFMSSDEGRHWLELSGGMWQLSGRLAGQGTRGVRGCLFEQMMAHILNKIKI